jgi:hypothetical protein
MLDTKKLREIKTDGQNPVAFRRGTWGAGGFLKTSRIGINRRAGGLGGELVDWVMAGIRMVRRAMRGARAGKRRSYLRSLREFLQFPDNECKTGDVSVYNAHGSQTHSNF